MSAPREEEHDEASKQAEELRNLYRGWAGALSGEMPLEEWRDMVEWWEMVTGEPGGTDYLETDAGGVSAMWAVPKGCAADRVLLCLHGGGFVVGSMYTHRKLFGHIAKAVGARALIPDFRRPPEHVHPAPLQDVVTAYGWLLEQGIDASHVAFTGDSVGGGLAITALLRAREQGLPLPAAAMPFSPWVDMEYTGEAKTAARKIRSPPRFTPTWRACHRCTSRSAGTNCSSMTAAAWPSTPVTPAWRSGSTSSAASSCSTPSSSQPGVHPKPTKRSAGLPSGYGPNSASPMPPRRPRQPNRPP